jgi:hypothetical protein
MRREIIPFGGCYGRIAAAVTREQEDNKMTNTVTEPKPREIAGTLRTIRSRWDRAERIERRHLAQTKQQQLARWLIAGQNRLGHAV